MSAQPDGQAGRLVLNRRGGGTADVVHQAPPGAATATAVLTMAVLGLNLRPALTSIGSMLADIRGATGMSGWMASVLVAAPMWCFAAGAPLAWHARRRWGIGRSVAVALVVLAAALAVRPFAGQLVLVPGTVLVCVAIAVLTVLLPAIVQAAPPGQRSRLFRAYSVALGTGSGLGALSPALAAVTSWQTAAAAWALLAAAALLAWRIWTPATGDSAGTTGTDATSTDAARPRIVASLLGLAPRRTAWSLTVHFALTVAYSFAIIGWLPSLLADVGVPAGQIPWMYWAAMTAGIPLAMRIPRWATRHEDQSALPVLLGTASLAGTLGLALNPTTGTWIWVMCIGAGMPAIVLALQILQLRAGDLDDTTALSALVTGGGYALAGVLTLATGLLHAATGDWTTSLVALLVMLIGQIVTGMTAGHPATVVINLNRAGERA